MGKRFDGSVYLDDPAFTLTEVAAISGVAAPSVRNWIDRGTLALGGRSPTGRPVFSLADAVRLATMQALTITVPLKPSDAALAAELVAREVLHLAATDATGRPMASPNAIPTTLALVLATVGGKMCAGWVDPAETGYRGENTAWSRAHVVLPIASLLDDVVHNLVALASRSAPEPIQ